jgi:aryl-alcohol dehydrogenase-like predicted oxidoreductase
VDNEGEAIALMHKAFDVGITLFDAADTYGNGLSEELIAKAFPNQRDEIVIATKVGYDFVHYGEARGRGQREIPQDLSPEPIARIMNSIAPCSLLPQWLRPSFWLRLFR